MPLRSYLRIISTPLTDFEGRIMDFLMPIILVWPIYAGTEPQPPKRRNPLAPSERIRLTIEPSDNPAVGDLYGWRVPGGP